MSILVFSRVRRESRQVPLIVSTCVEEVERRGLDDLGIYRISGLSSEIQRLKKAFERSECLSVRTLFKGTQHAA